MSLSRMAVLAASALMMGTTGASAQTCLGLPTTDGAIALAGSYSRVEGRDEVGGEFHADVTGPGAFGFAYRTDLADTGPSTYEARGSYDLFLLEPSICGVAGVRYTDVASAGVSERLAVPVGFGVGKTMDAGRLSATVYAIPQYMWVREVREDALGGEDVDISNGFTAEAGVTAGVLPVFVNGAITLNTLDNEPGFRIRLGVLF